MEILGQQSRLYLFAVSLLADIISSVEFDYTGDYLATGDKGGRVVLFERNDGVNMNIWIVERGFAKIESFIEKRL